MTEPQTPAGQAGQELADPDEQTTEDPNERVGPRAQNTRFNVMHRGDNRFLVHDRKTGKAYMADVEHTSLQIVTATGQDQVGDAEKQNAILGAIAAEGPSFRDGPDHYVSVSQEATGGAAPAGTADSSGGGDSGGSGDGELVQDVPNDYDEFDLSVLEDDVWDWIERASGFKTEFDPEIIEVETGRVEGSVGFVFDTNPFKAGYHTGDEWDDQDAFNAAREAWKEITQGEDEIDYHGDPDYVNFLPAAKVEEVTG